MRILQLIRYIIELIILIPISFLMYVRQHPVGLILKVHDLYNISAPIVIEEQPPQRFRELQVILVFPQSDVIVPHLR